MSSDPVKPKTDKPKKPRKLSLKRRLFVEHYVQNDGNGKQAALAAFNIQSPNASNVAQAIASEVLSSPTVQELVSLRFKEVQRRFSDYSERAAEIVKELAEKADEDKVRLSAAKDILDRAGHKPVEKSVEVSHKRIVLDI